MGTTLRRRLIYGTILGALFLTLRADTPMARELVVSVTAGFAKTTGDVDDNLIGTGLVLGGILYVGMTPQFFLSAGAHVSLFGGQDALGVPFTESARSFTLEGGGLYYFVDRTQKQLRPFVAAQVGFGFLSWSFSPVGQSVFLVGEDSNHFFFFAPEAGIEIGVTDETALIGGARFLLTNYGNETAENVPWDFNDGDFFEIYGGVTFNL